MTIPRLFIKKIGQAITNQTKIGGFKFPSEAKAFDYLTGTGKRGNFQIYSFRDSEGNLLRRESVFFKNGEKVRFAKNYTRNKKTLKIYERVLSSDNKPLHYSANIVVEINHPETKKVLFEQIKQKNILGQMHLKYRMLQSDASPKSIEFATLWDGTAPKLEYVNINKEFTEKNQEYLPLMSISVTPLLDDKIAHISAIQENIHGLKGITPPVKRLSRKELIPSIGYKADGITRPNGQINIAKELNSSVELLGILGHEYKHASDWSNMFRLEDTKDTPEIAEDILVKLEEQFPGFEKFCTKSINKGIITRDSDLGKEMLKIQESIQSTENSHYYKTRESHDSFYFEEKANEARDNELKKMYEVISKLYNFVIEA